VDVLLGSKNEKVLKYEHDKLSTYAIGTELNQKQWMHLARQLVQMGYLNQDGEFRTLSLTQKALEALRQRTKIMGQLQEVEERASKEAVKKAEVEYNHALFALLRAKRKELADEAGVPPYVVFSDRTLVEMAAYFPQSSQSLLAISGVGQAKLKQYGDAFLDVIKPYCKKHSLAERRKELTSEKGSRKKSSSSQSRASGEEELGMRTTLVAEAFNAGASIESLTERYAVTVGTILDHLARYASAGNRLRSGSDLQAYTSSSPDDQQTAMQAFDEFGAERLKPVFDKLEGRVNYDELKVLRLMYLSRD
jgi:ATP-dependent DNA helicase RecQ